MAAKDLRPEAAQPETQPGETPGASTVYLTAQGRLLGVILGTFSSAWPMPVPQKLLAILIQSYLPSL